MQKKEAALHRGNDDSARIGQGRPEHIVADYTLATTWAAVLLGISFGAMIALGILLGW